MRISSATIVILSPDGQPRIDRLGRLLASAVVSVLFPIRAGGLVDLDTGSIEGALESGAYAILAFEELEDALAWQRQRHLAARGATQ